ncbi:hypothetical protein GOBAR_AA07684 [Gossypium barbadense]|uniref:C2 domain-containing protein n=1 Tax=Gossypium barbadense TaxID=3634 RepID=A0A2P5YBH4_GOSBA|nr:hypothetical protein GOBAR_AA07684 [Gossypium barbadense]
MMNGLLELELWRIIGQGNDESGGGYFGGGREKLGHTAVGHARFPSFQPVRFVGFEIGHIGVHSHVARSCQSSIASPTPRWCEEFTLLIPAINFINLRFKMDIVYLKCVEFRMNYLDCTIWENTEYCKKNFVIRLRSGNARICYI